MDNPHGNVGSLGGGGGGGGEERGRGKKGEEGRRRERRGGGEGAGTREAQLTHSGSLYDIRGLANPLEKLVFGESHKHISRVERLCGGFH